MAHLKTKPAGQGFVLLPCVSPGLQPVASQHHTTWVGAVRCSHPFWKRTRSSTPRRASRRGRLRGGRRTIQTTTSAMLPRWRGGSYADPVGRSRRPRAHTSEEGQWSLTNSRKGFGMPRAQLCLVPLLTNPTSCMGPLTTTLLAPCNPKTIALLSVDLDRPGAQRLRACLRSSRRSRRCPGRATPPIRRAGSAVDLKDSPAGGKAPRSPRHGGPEEGCLMTPAGGDRQPGGRRRPAACIARADRDRAPTRSQPVRTRRRLGRWSSRLRRCCPTIRCTDVYPQSRAATPSVAAGDLQHRRGPTAR